MPCPEHPCFIYQGCAVGHGHITQQMPLVGWGVHKYVPKGECLHRDTGIHVPQDPQEYPAGAQAGASSLKLRCPAEVPLRVLQW